jgi:hypothetical protein
MRQQVHGPVESGEAEGELKREDGAARVGAAAGAAHGAAYDPDHAYTFGLQRVLDGLGALIDTSGA